MSEVNLCALQVSLREVRTFQMSKLKMCVFYVEEGLPKTQVLLWVSGEQLRAVFENVLLAEYHCRYDWRDRKVKNIGKGEFCPTRFASPQGTLIPLTP
jgi:hypothetical protein